MSLSAIETRPARTANAGWGALAGAIAIGLLIIGAAFREEIVSAVSVWNASTAYSHCFFVLPIAAYLGWDRRHALACVPIVPLPAAVLLALPLAAAWLVAERLGIMEGRQLVMLSLVQVLFLAVLGWRMWWALCIPLLYLFFLVPFGAFLTPALQSFTARFLINGLDILGIPNYSDEFTIEIPEGTFFVAEACAGLRFLIASIAFGVLYSCLIYRSPGRRVLFVLASIVVPVIANGIRALGIVVLGHVIGSAEAAATDHILYGWMFFSIVILLLIAAGLPFRQDTQAPQAAAAITPRPGPVAPGNAARMMIVAAVLGLLASVGPAAAAMLDRSARTIPSAVRPQFAIPADCTADATAPEPLTLMDAPALRQRFVCGAARLTVTVATLSARANPVSLIGAQRLLTGEFDAEDVSVHSLAAGSANWRLTETSGPATMTATLIWIDGNPMQLGLRERARQAVNSVFGTMFEPVIVSIGLKFETPHLSEQERDAAKAVLRRFIDAQDTLSTQIRTQSASRPPA